MNASIFPSEQIKQTCASANNNNDDIAACAYQCSRHSLQQQRQRPRASVCVCVPLQPPQPATTGATQRSPALPAATRLTRHTAQRRATGRNVQCRAIPPETNNQKSAAGEKPARCETRQGATCGKAATGLHIRPLLLIAGKLASGLCFLYSSWFRLWNRDQLF